MPETPQSDAPVLDAAEEAPTGESVGDSVEASLVEESLVEEVSIDGMCGVY